LYIPIFKVFGSISHNSIKTNRMDTGCWQVYTRYWGHSGRKRCSLNFAVAYSLREGVTLADQKRGSGTVQSPSELNGGKSLFRNKNNINFWKREKVCKILLADLFISFISSWIHLLIIPFAECWSANECQDLLIFAYFPQ
jgi:hypothetical protein